jgi:hypothetical protein
MGWGVQVSTDVYASRVTKNGVKPKMEENDDLIQMFEKELMMLVSSNPRDIASEDSRSDGSIVEELRIKVDNILESYKDCIRQNTVLSIILDEIDNAIDC